MGTIEIYIKSDGIIKNYITREEILTRNYIYDVGFGCILFRNEEKYLCLKLYDGTVHIIMYCYEVIILNASFNEDGSKFVVLSQKPYDLVTILIYDIILLSVEYTRNLHEYKYNSRGKIFFIKNKIFIPFITGCGEKDSTVELNNIYIIHFYDLTKQMIYNKDVLNYCDSVDDIPGIMLSAEVAHSDNLKVYMTFNVDEKIYYFKIIIDGVEEMMVKRCEHECVYIREIFYTSKFKFDE